MAKRIAYYRALARLLYEEQDWTVTGTATTSTGTTTLYDTANLKYTSFDANLYDKKWVYGMEAADASTRGYAQVTAGGWSGSAGTLALDSVVTGLVSTDLYVITKHQPTILQNVLNYVWRNMYPPSLFPLSMHIMGNDANDMEPSTIATDYTVENSGTLATESTTIYRGAQSLKATAGAALSGASTGNISVFENKQYYTAAMCSVTQDDDADFRVVNVQDSDAQIDDNATSDEPAWTEMVVPFTPPSGCEQVDIFMLGKTSGDVIYWEDFQIWALGYSVYTLPSFVTRPEQVIEVVSFPQGAGGPASDFDYRADEQRSRNLSWGWESADPRGNLRIWVECDSGRPFISIRRPLTELTTDAATSVASLDDTVRWAARYVEAEGADAKAKVLAQVRARYFSGLTVVLPDRVGVR